MAAAQPRALLESGDRLTRDEFHRRFCLRPDLKRAELVQGVVYVPSPASYGLHGEQQGLIVHWLATYALRKPGIRHGFDATVLLGADTEVMPDAFLFALPPTAGGARVRDDGYIEGPPQLVVEVAASTASYDLHDKRDAYRRAGVREYLVWRVLDGQLDWFLLQDGEYVRQPPDVRGVIVSTTFPGLRLNVEKLLAGDAAGVLAELDAASGN